MRTTKDVFQYEKDALNSIPIDHPHYKEIRNLLIQQINEDLHDATHPILNR